MGRRKDELPEGDESVCAYGDKRVLDQLERLAIGGEDRLGRRRSRIRRGRVRGGGRGGGADRDEEPGFASEVPDGRSRRVEMSG